MPRRTSTQRRSQAVEEYQPNDCRGRFPKDRQDRRIAPADTDRGAAVFGNDNYSSCRMIVWQGDANAYDQDALSGLQEPIDQP